MKTHVTTACKNKIELDKDDEDRIMKIYDAIFNPHIVHPPLLKPPAKLAPA